MLVFFLGIKSNDISWVLKKKTVNLESYQNWVFSVYICVWFHIKKDYIRIESSRWSQNLYFKKKKKKSSDGCALSSML